MDVHWSDKEFLAWENKQLTRRPSLVHGAQVLRPMFELVDDLTGLTNKEINQSPTFAAKRDAELHRSDIIVG